MSLLTVCLVWLWHHCEAVIVDRYYSPSSQSRFTERASGTRLTMFLTNCIATCFRLHIPTNSRWHWVGPSQEHSPALFLSLPSSIGNGSGKRKAESPKAVAPTTAGPGYHLAPGNTAESRRRQKPIPTRREHEQRGRDTASSAACCRCGEPIQPGSRSFRGG